MPASKVEKEFVSYVIDLMQSIGPVYARAMFGGHGVYLEGLMFALIANNTLFLKVDKALENGFVESGLEPFTYNRQGKEFKMSYFQAPEDALEDSELMNIWANKAYGVELREASKKRKDKN